MRTVETSLGDIELGTGEHSNAEERILPQHNVKAAVEIMSIVNYLLKSNLQSYTQLSRMIQFYH